jgi:hypothetical protein
MQACFEEASAAGKPNTMLMQVVSNTTSYSLYVNLGFKPLETCLNIAGYCGEDPGQALMSYDFRKLTPTDTNDCDVLFTRLDGTYPWSRKGEIGDMIAGAGETVYGLWEPDTKKLVAFTTGTVLGGFIVAADAQVRLRM